MGDTEHGAQLMFQAVGGKVLLRAALSQVVMGQRASPHNLSPQTIVIRLAQHLDSTVLHRTQQCFGNGVGQCHLIIFREVALHRVHHNIGTASRSLIGWQRIGALRVHNGEATAAEVAIDATLDKFLILGDNA